nr:uncharacterized protein LOC108082317 [Drosophila kikkawai]
MKVYCNEQVPYGKPTPIVISMKVRPVKTTITVSLSTPTYLLAFFEVGNESEKKPPEWKRTSSISKELAVLAIPECSQPVPPRKILITRGFYVRAVFLEKCNLTIEKGVYNWSLSNAVGLTQLATYSTDGPLLKVQQYSWRYPTSQELLRDFYLLKVEGRFEGLYYAARCYLKVEMGPVEAVISGGKHRRSGQKDILWINGSMSYDFSKRSSEKQFSTFLWNCKSIDDKNNPFCRPNISSEAAFSIPGNSLKTGCTYVFQLQVSRDHNPRISSEMYQNVAIVGRSVLQVKIECLKNCQRDFYTPNSRVKLKAVCLNCENMNAAQRWSIDGQKMFSTKEITLHIRKGTNRTQVELAMLAEDGRYERNVKTLVRNSGPTGGKCTVSPREGQEAITNFVPCCQRFVSQNQPIEYWYYAGKVLLGSCLDCNCGVRLPATSFLQVLACEALYACHSSWIKVKVTPLVGIPTQPAALQKYMISSSNSFVKLLKGGLYSSYLQSLNAIASRISLADSGTTLLHGFENIQPYTPSSLSLLANLTRTLGQRLPTSDPKTQVLLIMLVRKLTYNFQEVMSNVDAVDMTQKPFISTTLACLEVYRLMQKIAEKIPQPPASIYDRYQKAFLKGSLDLDFVDKLHSEIAIRRTSHGNWLNFMWAKDHLGFLMNIFQHINKDQNMQDNKSSPKAEVLVQCFETQTNDTIIVHSTDSLYSVVLSRKLFDEILGTGETEICFKLISIQRTLNWWYPDEKRPTSRMLSVRIFEKGEDVFTKQIKLLKSELGYETNMTIHTTSPAKDKDVMTKNPRQTHDALKEIHAGRYISVVRNGQLETLQSVQLYRIILDEQTVMAVHFTRSTHKLQVKLKLEVKPLWSEISKSWCVVPSLSTNTTFLLRNKCHQPKRAYMALRVWSKIPIWNCPNTTLVDGPALYTFAFQIRSCASWLYNRKPDQQGWDQGGCVPTMDFSVARKLRCICKVLGTYTSYVYYIPAIKVSVGTFTKPSLHKGVVAFYSLLLIFILLSMYWLYRYANNLPAKSIFIRMPADDDAEDDEELHDLLIKLNTEGRVNSQTTASVTLVLISINQKKRKIRIPQDPERSFLNRNSTLNVWLRSREIRIPTKLMIYHNNAGRYPSWFLRRIEVSDVQTQETQIFVVRKWVTDKVLSLEPTTIFRKDQVRALGTYRRRFRLHIEMLFCNWALWQPLTGNWRENDHFKSISRAKRFCAFVSKLVIAYTSCAIYFQKTTIESLQLHRDKFLTYKDLLFLILLVTTTDFIFQVLFKLTAHHLLMVKDSF